jgi:hypothetical protein
MEETARSRRPPRGRPGESETLAVAARSECLHRRAAAGAGRRQRVRPAGKAVAWLPLSSGGLGMTWPPAPPELLSPAWRLGDGGGEGEGP